MHYLTNYYKNLAEQLQDRVNHLTQLVETAKNTIADDYSNIPAEAGSTNLQRNDAWKNGTQRVSNDSKFVNDVNHKSEIEANVMNPSGAIDPQLERSKARRIATEISNRSEKNGEFDVELQHRINVVTNRVADAQIKKLKQDEFANSVMNPSGAAKLSSKK